MLSQQTNRVQAIKSKFENLKTCETAPKKQSSQLYRLKNVERKGNEENASCPIELKHISFATAADANGSPSGECAAPNSSYLHKCDVKRTASEPKPSLSRQSSDPGKKLHRSHAFRCDKTQKLSPQRNRSCNSRPEAKMERKLSKDRLKRLGDVLDQQMRKENYKTVGLVKEVGFNSIPDENVPPHILAQYSQVVKPKKVDKGEALTDSGVSSETENLEEEKGRVKKITNQFDEKFETETLVNSNLDVMEDLAGSSETMKLERKNPHLVLTDTLKKALKQPLPPGPPPKKPPRINVPSIPENEKKDTKRKLEKLEHLLLKRETAKKDSNIYDIAEENLSLKRPKEVHYLCTEILDITQRTLLPPENESPLKNCLNKLNCVTYNSMSSLPYTRLSSIEPNSKACSCSSNCLSQVSTFLNDKCMKCQSNEEKHGFKCHLDCKCRLQNSEFYVDEHIYDEPCNSLWRERSQYGTINNVNGAFSKSMEDLRVTKKEEAIYEIPCDNRCSTPDVSPKMPKTDFQKLLKNFENGVVEPKTPKEKLSPSKLPPNTLKDLIFSPKSVESLHNASPILHSTASGNRKSPKNCDNSKTLPNASKISPMSAAGKISPKMSDVGKISPKGLNTGKISLKRIDIKISPKILEDGKISPKVESGAFSAVPKIDVSSEDASLNAEAKFAKRVDRKFCTEVKRYKPGNRSVVYSLPRKNPQLDVDRENLNALMNEIYETVTAACNMEENKPGSFPTDQSDGTTSEESVKLTRSLTEKRKNYVRRVSSRLAYLEPKNIKTTRIRHQTSICSFKSETIDNPYSTFRSWKSFRASQNNLTAKMESDSKFNLTDSTGNVLSMKDEFDSDIDISIDEKAGCVDIELPFEPRENGLFNVCLLVGMNYMTAKAYVKTVFPSKIQVPQHIENLIFPETLSQDKGEWPADAESTQCYSFILTDERGERSYGYCRRVLPEGATTCLPLCYCIIGKYRAPGFYYKVLQEIESHHGGSDTEMQTILEQLFESDFPNPGEEITLTIDTTDFEDDNCNDRCHIPDVKCTEVCKSAKCTEKSVKCTEVCKSAKCIDNTVCTGLCNSVNCTPSVKCSDINTDSIDADSVKCNGSVKCIDNCKSGVKCTEKCKSNVKCQTMPDIRRNSEKFYDPENTNSMRELMLSLDGIRVKTITRPLEPRAEESSSCTLLDCLGAGLLVKVFGSLLLERKLIVRADKLSTLSSLLEALQSSLYPFVWQQPLISCVPSEIHRAVIDAPLPILAGMLHKPTGVDTLEEGMFIDLSHPSKVLCYQGDEATILPTNSYKTLKTSLQMEAIKNKERDDTRARNVMISEAFLRFFVDILGDFWRFFHRGVLEDGDLGKGDVIFDKDSFIKSTSSKQNQYFLEWFTETAMFNHFIQNMAVRFNQADGHPSNLVDTPTPNYYQLFEERINSRRIRSGVDRSGYKNALNKRVKLLKARLKDLVG